MNILISSCLLGEKCRYNATDSYCVDLEKYKNKHTFISVCPEILGGMNTPRDPAERKGNTVITKAGEDVTEFYRRGAIETLRIAKMYNCEIAIMKERSPSCGKDCVYDGNFTGNIIDGNGVTVDLLLQNGIKVFGESQFCLLDDLLV